MSALRVAGTGVVDLQANPADLVPKAPGELFDADTSRGVRWAWVPGDAHWNGFAHGFDYVEYNVELAAASPISRVEVHPLDRPYVLNEGWKCVPDRIRVNGVEVNLPTSYDKAETLVSMPSDSNVLVRLEGSFGFTRGTVHQRVVALNGILFYA